MYLLGYSLDNLSLMALTVATGFVVDDAIVVVENVTRHLEGGQVADGRALLGGDGDRLHASCRSRSRSSPSSSPSCSMGGIVGRLFREFAVTLSVAIAVLARWSRSRRRRMMCARLLQRPREENAAARTRRASGRSTRS